MAVSATAVAERYLLASEYLLRIFMRKNLNKLKVSQARFSSVPFNSVRSLSTGLKSTPTANHLITLMPTVLGRCDKNRLSFYSNRVAFGIISAENIFSTR